MLKKANIENIKIVKETEREIERERKKTRRLKQTDHDAGEFVHTFPFYVIAKGWVLNNEMITVIGYVSSSLLCTRFISCTVQRARAPINMQVIKVDLALARCTIPQHRTMQPN